MKQIVQQHKTVECLANWASTYKDRPQKFTPQQVVDVVGGAATNVGHVADAVLAELQARGIDIKYERQGRKRFFVLL